MLSEQFIWFGGMVVLVAGLGYIVATVRGQARPNRVSWGLWSATSWLAFLGQLDEGVGAAAVLTFAAALTPSLIFLGSFVGGADWRFSRLDVTCLLLALATLVAWQITASGLVAIVLSIAVDAIAGIPTIVQAWREPESESHLPYTAGMVSAACTLLALDEFTLASAAFAIYFLSLCSILTVELLVVPQLRRVHVTLLPRPGHAQLPLPQVGPTRSISAQAADGPELDLAESRTDSWSVSSTAAAPLSIEVLSARTVDAGSSGADTGARPAASPAEHPAPRGGASPLVILVAAMAIAAVTISMLGPPTVQPPTTSITFAASQDDAAVPHDQPDRAGSTPPRSFGPVAPSIAVPTVRGKIPAGKTPGHLEIAPNGRFGLIAHRDAGVISVFDTATNTVTSTIAISAGPPMFVTFSPDGQRAYVSIYNLARTVNLIGVLDTTTMSLIGTVPVGPRPFAPAVTPDGAQLWVPSHDAGRIDVIDTSSAAVLRSIPVPPNPHWVAFSDDGKRAYIASHESNVVVVLDTVTMAQLATIPVSSSPHSTAVAAGSAQASVVSYDAGTVSIIDTVTAAVTAEVPVGRGPQDLAYAPDGRYLYTANVDDDTVSVVDTAAHAVTATIPVCDGPTSVSANPNGRQAYVTCVHSGEVMILATSAA